MALGSSISLDLIQTHSLLYGWVIFHCVFVQLLYPFIFQQRSRLLLCLQWTLQYMCFFQLLFSQGVCPVVGLLGHQIRSDQISRSVVSDSLQPHESQHARPPCPSPTPGVLWDLCPSSQRCHPAISSSVIPFSSCPQSLPASVFSNESTLRMRWPKYWSFGFSIIPSKEHRGLISFRMDWLDLLAVRSTI